MKICRRIMAGSGFLACMMAGAILQAGTTNIYWTGGAGDGLWNNAGNWLDEWGSVRVPGLHDQVYLSHPDHGPAGHREIQLNVNATIDKLWFAGTGDRTVDFSSVNGEVLTIVQQYCVEMDSGATADGTLNVSIQLAEPHPAQFFMRQDSAAAELIIGPDALFLGSYRLDLFGTGMYRFESTQTETGSFRLRVTGSRATVDLQGGGIAAGSLYMANDSRLLLASDAMAHGGSYLSVRDNGTVYVGSVVEQDVRLQIDRLNDGRQEQALMQVLENPAGGHLTIAVNRWDDTSNCIATVPGSTVELGAGSLIGFSETRPAVTGGGNLLLKTAEATDTFETRRQMTYTGRTMIERGILLFSTAADRAGSLPDASIVEIGAAGGLRILDQQTIAGLRDYQGTAGFVTLERGDASLTIAGGEDTAFGGAIHGDGEVRGELIKQGSGAFTLTAGGQIYDLAAVTVAEGVFGIAGGRVEAGELSAAGAAFAVTLMAGDRDAVLLDISGDADITGAALDLALAAGYSPELWSEYTLLNAATITGASPQDGMFGYVDGQELKISEHPFRIDYIEGNDSIVLTAIPEPSVLALLGFGLGFLLRRRRDR